MTPGGIYCLDLSATCGWAYGHLDDTAPECGSWHLSESKLLGAKLASYENELIHALELRRPRLVVVEAPLPAMRQASSNVARQQFALAGITEAECWRARIQVREADASTVRKRIIGQGRFPAGTAKDHVLAFCRSKGWSAVDHHAADACLLWEFSRGIEDRMRRY